MSERVTLILRICGPGFRRSRGESIKGWLPSQENTVLIAGKPQILYALA
jgi:hypothetical protein